MERKPIKNMYVRVVPPGDKTPAAEPMVRVTAPERMPEEAILRFLHSREAWITRQRARLLSQPREPGRYEGGERVFVWGKALPLYVAEAMGGANAKRGAAESNGTLYLFCRPGDGPAERKALVSAWRRERLLAAVALLAPECERRTGLHANEWRAREMKTRWGSCNTRDARVWLNVRLTEHPVECLEYVMLHELTHLAEPGHGAAFYAALASACPDWRARRAKLNGL